MVASSSSTSLRARGHVSGKRDNIEMEAHEHLEDKSHRRRDTGTLAQMFVVSLVSFMIGTLVSWRGGPSASKVAESSMSSTSSMQSIKKAVHSNTLSNRYPPGWHPVHVFSGGLDLLLDRETFTRNFTMQHTPKNPLWSGQIKQDQLVYELLGNKNNGYFVEAAANDAIYLSNSFALEQYRGWNGICVEGNPIYWYWLSFRKCAVAGALVGKNKGDELDVTFDETDGELGGIAKNHLGRGHQAAPKLADMKERNHKKRTTTLVEILDMFEAPSEIDFLSLDVEGAEEFIMQGFDFGKYRFSLMTVERPSTTLHDLLRANGYTAVMTLAASFGETLFAHKSLNLDPANNILQHWCKKTNPDKCGAI